jgi:nitrite reductase (NADH) small subunit
MSTWVRACSAADAPQPGAVCEADAGGVAVCLANIDGNLHALDNWCPHRRGPLGEGWVEGNAVVCPWHSWAFNVHTGLADPPERARVALLPLRLDSDGSVLVDIA